MWEDFKEEYVKKVVEEYAKPLVEDPRKSSINHSSVVDELPATFSISESRINKLMAKNNMNQDEEEDNEDEQKQLLQNLITNLRESQDDDFDLEDADHNYMSDSDDIDEEEEFPDMEFDPLQYASVRTQLLHEEQVDNFEDRNYWNTSRLMFDTDELLRTL